MEEVKRWKQEISKNDYAQESDDQEDSDSNRDTNEDDDTAEEETSSNADNMLEQASVSGKEPVAHFRNIYHTA